MQFELILNYKKIKLKKKGRRRRAFPGYKAFVQGSAQQPKQIACAIAPRPAQGSNPYSISFNISKKTYKQTNFLYKKRLQLVYFLLLIIIRNITLKVRGKILRGGSIKKKGILLSDNNIKKYYKIKG